MPRHNNRKEKTLLEAYDEITFNTQLFPGLTPADDTSQYYFPLTRGSTRRRPLDLPERWKNANAADRANRSIVTDERAEEKSGEAQQQIENSANGRTEAGIHRLGKRKREIMRDSEEEQQDDRLRRKLMDKEPSPVLSTADSASTHSTTPPTPVVYDTTSSSLDDKQNGHNDVTQSAKEALDESEQCSTKQRTVSSSTADSAEAELAAYNETVTINPQQKKDTQSQDPAVTNDNNSMISQQSDIQTNEQAAATIEPKMPDTSCPPVNGERVKEDFVDAENASRAVDENRALKPKEVEVEIQKLYSTCPDLKSNYQLIDKIGYGSFGTVYKAIDLQQEQENNLVAIKVVFDYSSPERILNEIKFLKTLSDSPNIAPMLNVFRINCLVFVVLKYIEADDFYRTFDKLTVTEIKCYISELLKAVDSVHKKGIMHRDIKPSNFLYNRKTKTGHLIDFGLATTSNKLSTQKTSATALLSKASTEEPTMPPGYYQYDERPHFNANRTGTRGFRAPETLLRYEHQTTAVDMWAVGVILAIFLSKHYPFFEPEDDADALIEISKLFGKKKMIAFSAYYERQFRTNIPLKADSLDLVGLFKSLNSNWQEQWKSDEEFRSAIDLAERCLQLIHSDRITASEALKHPFLAL